MERHHRREEQGRLRQPVGRVPLGPLFVRREAAGALGRAEAQPLDFYSVCYGYELTEDEANLIIAAKKIGLWLSEAGGLPSEGRPLLYRSNEMRLERRI